MTDVLQLPRRWAHCVRLLGVASQIFWPNSSTIHLSPAYHQLIMLTFFTQFNGHQNSDVSVVVWPYLWLAGAPTIKRSEGSCCGEEMRNGPMNVPLFDWLVFAFVSMTRNILMITCPNTDNVDIYRPFECNWGWSDSREGVFWVWAAVMRRALGFLSTTWLRKNYKYLEDKKKSTVFPFLRGHT